jgi:competence protein ComEA
VDEFLYRWDELRRRPVVVLGVLTLAVVIVGLAWLANHRSGPDDRLPIDERIPVISLSATSAPTTVDVPLIVHVTGAVSSPGVYELDVGDRILDALARAGGPTAEGQPDQLNLAAPVVDGMKIRVPVEGEAALVVGSSPGAVGFGPVDLNTATSAQLEALPGVGPATAASILSYRESIGRFGSVADLLGVRGIGEAKLASLEDLVIVR